MKIRCPHCIIGETERNPNNANRWYCKSCASQGNVATAMYECPIDHTLLFQVISDNPAIRKYECHECGMFYIMSDSFYTQFKS